MLAFGFDDHSSEAVVGIDAALTRADIGSRLDDRDCPLAKGKRHDWYYFANNGRKFSIADCFHP